MSKVRSEVIEAALIKLVDNINSTMPDTKYKFILGGAAGLLGISGFEQIKGVIASFADDDGLVDTEKIKAVYQSAFKASGGKLQIELFNKPNSLLSMFVKPLTLTLTQEDIDSLMAEVEQNSVVTEVSLKQKPAPQPTQLRMPTAYPDMNQHM